METEKSRLGISLNLFAALLYFMGVTGSVFALMVAVGYIMLFEESVKLKKTGIKALIVNIFWSIIMFLINHFSVFLQTILNALNSYNYIAGNNSVAFDNFHINYLYQFLQFIPSSLTTIGYVIEILVFVILGLRAYKQVDVKIKWIDKILDKHFV
ncbi:MAG: hypothetical protein FWH48_00270 [Oscillospiraceae bacterium]|nr:hypothetical protein [Oscillospiraceae bacterium]